MKATDTSPAKLLLEEIEVFRSTFRTALDAYALRIDEELTAIRSKIEEVGGINGIPSSKIRDIRDMLTLLHNVDVKPEKGRRKDLKKLDSIANDLAMMVESW